MGPDIKTPILLFAGGFVLMTILGGLVVRLTSKHKGHQLLDAYFFTFAIPAGAHLLILIVSSISLIFSRRSSDSEISWHHFLSIFVYFEVLCMLFFYGIYVYMRLKSGSRFYIRAIPLSIIFALIMLVFGFGAGHIICNVADILLTLANTGSPSFSSTLIKIDNYVIHNLPYAIGFTAMHSELIEFAQFDEEKRMRFFYLRAIGFAGVFVMVIKYYKFIILGINIYAHNSAITSFTYIVFIGLVIIYCIREIKKIKERRRLFGTGTIYFAPYVFLASFVMIMFVVTRFAPL